ERQRRLLCASEVALLLGRPHRPRPDRGLRGAQGIDNRGNGDVVAAQPGLHNLMDVNYGKGAPFTLGVEEELQLVSSQSFDLTSRYAEVFGEAARHDDRIKEELLQSTVEVATEPCGTVGEAIAEAAELRRRAQEEAEPRGVRVLSAGTHPFSRYEHQDVTDKPRYVELVDALQWAVERQLIFGLHV